MIRPPLRTIIAGSRDIISPAAVETAVRSSGLAPYIIEVVSGGARGVDKLGEAWAALRGIPVCVMLADWARYPRTAGRLRNTEMARYADALVAVWDGRSPGTKHMVDTMLSMGKVTYVYRVPA
jgi:hypothetical protein